MGWRDLRKAAKAVVHATFQVQAVYLADKTLDPVACMIRLHDKAVQFGMNLTEATATMAETQPKIIFSVAEVPNPLPRAYVVIAADEVYRLGAAEPAIAGYVTVEATRLESSATHNLISSLTLTDPAWVGVLL